MEPHKVIRTDDREYRIYHKEQMIRVHNLQIKLGEIVPNEKPSAVLRLGKKEKEWTLYQRERSILLKTLGSWA